MSSVTLSVKLAIDANCVEPPSLTSGLGGVSEREFVVPLTVSVAVPTSPSNSAEMVAVPGCIAVAWPIVPGMLLIVATETGEAVHETVAVRS